MGTYGTERRVEMQRKSSLSLIFPLKGLDGHLVTRVAMPLDALVRLQQQIQEVLVGLREARQRNAKE